VVADRPKCLAEISGRPFLEDLLAALDGQGLRRAVLCTGHLGDQVRTRFGARFGRIELAHSREPAPLGTAGALALALAVPGLGPGPYLVLNGDSLVKADLRAFWEWYRQGGIHHGILLVRVADAGRYGGVQLGPGGRIERFLEKGAGGPGWVNAGVYLLPAALLATLPADRPTSLEREVFPGLAGRDLHGFPCEGGFLDIGTPEAYGLAGTFLNEREDDK
jgi:NDP-sugar pyrophosphorylase family protein